MRRLGMLLAVVVAAVLLPTPAVAGPADDIAALVNEARWANGQAGLVRNAAMDRVAADWAAQLAASGTLSHNPDYAAQIPGGWTAAAENVAQGHPTAAAMHDGWMASSGHRANILGAYTDIGIAFLSTGGTTWGVEVFATYPGHAGPTAPAPPPAAVPVPDPADEVPAAEATPEPMPVPTTTASPSEAATADDDPTERVVAARDTPPGIGPGWTAGLIAGVIVLGGGAALALRRRRPPATHLLER